MLQKAAPIILIALLSIPACKEEAPPATPPKPCDTEPFYEDFSGEPAQGEKSKALIAKWLDEKCPIDKDIIEGLTAIQLSAIAGDTALIARCLERGADINSSKSHRVSALTWSMTLGHPKTAQFLLDKGAVPNGTKGSHSLFQAMKYPELFDDLIARGADVKRADKQGITILHGAAQFEKGTKYIPKIIELKADIDALNYKDRTPIFLAAMNGNDSAIELLIKAGAKLELRDKDNMTALDYAKEQKHPGATKLMEEALKKLHQPPPAHAPTSVLITDACRAALDAKLPGWTVQKIDYQPILQAAKQNKINPVVAVGDFDGNKLLDRAVLIRKGKRTRLAVCFAEESGSVRVQLLKEPHCNDIVSTIKAGSKVFSYELGKDEAIKNDGISLYCFEKAGSVYVLEKGKFREIVNSD